jgi:hypothetical protein
MQYITNGKTNWQYIIIVAVVAIIAGAVALWAIQGMNFESWQIGSQNQTTIQTTNQSSGQNSGTASLSYTQALNLYKNRRIQFSPACVVIPNYVVFKKGTTIMLDNRSKKSRPVALDEQVYNMKGYGFTFVTLATASPLPHTIKVDCGNGENTGRIVLEK